MHTISLKRLLAGLLPPMLAVVLLFVCGGAKGYALLPVAWPRMPAWLFLSCFLVLYLLCGLAAYQTLDPRVSGGEKAMCYYYAQLGIGALWIVFFFGLSLYVSGVALLAAQFIMAIIAFCMFWQHTKLAGRLFLPMLLWLLYLMYINIAALSGAI